MQTDIREETRNTSTQLQNHEERRGDREKSPTVLTRDESVSQTENESRTEPIQVPRPLAMQAVIPGLPKTVLEAIGLWRKGSTQLFYRPVRFYALAKDRRRLIPNYSNTAWVQSNQKYKFLRFQKLARAVALCNLTIQDISIEVSDEEWEKARTIFSGRYSEKVTPSKILSSLGK